jgi:hypothetical protein
MRTLFTGLIGKVAAQEDGLEKTLNKLLRMRYVFVLLGSICHSHRFEK